MGSGKSKLELNYGEGEAWIVAGDAVKAVTPYPGAFHGYSTGEKVKLPFGDASESATCAAFYVHYRSLGSAKNQTESDNIRSEVEMHASVFNNVCKVFSPIYRPIGKKGTDLENAYSDVRRAFKHFLENMWERGPFILAGDGLGSYLLARLMSEPMTVPFKRVVAAYLPGCPVRASDFPELRKDLLVSWHTKFKASDAEPVHYFYAGGSRPYGKSEVVSADASAMSESKSDDEPYVLINPMTFDVTAETPAVKNPGAMDHEGLIYAKAVGCKVVDDGAAIVVTPSASVSYESGKCSDILPFYMSIRLSAADKYAAFKRLEAL